MTMTDPVADMLTRIRNASSAHQERTTMPSSKLKVNVAKILQQEGYIQSFEVHSKAPQDELEIELKYGPNRERVLTGLKRISKPGLRVYVKHNEIPRVLGGLGVAILSTNKGVLTDREAREQSAGGEILAYVW